MELILKQKESHENHEKRWGWKNKGELCPALFSSIQVSIYLSIGLTQSILFPPLFSTLLFGLLLLFVINDPPITNLLACHARLDANYYIRISLWILLQRNLIHVLENIELNYYLLDLHSDSKRWWTQQGQLVHKWTIAMLVTCMCTAREYELETYETFLIFYKVLYIQITNAHIL